MTSRDGSVRSSCIAGARTLSASVPIPTRCRVTRTDRATLAAPVDGRIHFAGEACSEHDFSTAHGAYLTGAAAAKAVVVSLE